MASSLMKKEKWFTTRDFTDLYTFKMNGRKFNFFTEFIRYEIGRKGRREDLEQLDKAQVLATVLFAYYKKKRYKTNRIIRELRSRLYIDISHEMEDKGQRAVKDKVESLIFRNEEYQKLEKKIDMIELRIDTLYGVFAIIKSRREDVVYMYGSKKGVE